MSDVECPFCHAKADEHCSTKSGKNHPSRDRAIWYDRLCKAEHTIGSYPGDETMFCELETGHAGEHRTTYEWDNAQEASSGGQDGDAR